MKFNKTLMIILIIVFACTFFVVKKSHISYNCIVKGISIEKACQLASDKDMCFIVKTSNAATGARYTIQMGKFEGCEVELSGKHSPSSELSGVFIYAENNFLIYAKELRNESNLDRTESYPNYFTIVVDKWYPITPINRMYDFRDYQTNEDFDSRFFYPKEYIDEFDLVNKDYMPK